MNFGSLPYQIATGLSMCNVANSFTGRALLLSKQRIAVRVRRVESLVEKFHPPACAITIILNGAPE
jgi:hypothetical protein